MKGDPILIQDRHKRIGSAILSKIEGIANSYSGERILKLVLGIAGESGTGKTEVAKVLQEDIYKKLSLTCKVIHVDDYYKTNWHKRTEVRLEKGIRYVGHNEISWKKLNRVIRNFKERKASLNVQQIHMYTDSIEKQIVNAQRLNVIIVEGLYALYTKGLDYSVFLEGSMKDTYSFRKTRGKENPDDKFRNKILEKEAKEVLASKPNANLVIPYV